MTHTSIYDRASESMAWLLQQLPQEVQRPKSGIICGSGLGGLADLVVSRSKVEIPYGRIPYFPQSTVEGHVGSLVFGFLGWKQTPVVLMVGRVHFYEGHSIEDVTFPVRVMKLLGVEQIIVTNAAGGLNPEYKVGDIVVLSDHLNLAGISGVHPLRGPNLDKFGTRFPPLSDAYDLSLRRLTHKTWKNAGINQGSRTLHEGIYAFVGGPR
ncbi:MAG: hypothetical protein GOMPHAMPRED_003891 [Gomphillus americanus]|uniref:purine-nucleoside phosphorylase n=1 Tax=Gomphillus americanus TaxID=1940652 RepID=A0A8H3IT91_9LECA|nr:MAG: hypothetical protein GOMPHAMPRED_003891 [Gomphillus americanus]